MKNVYCYNYPGVGALGIAEKDGAVCRVFFAGIQALRNFDLAETPLIREAAAQLTEYFNGARQDFDLPLLLEGTEFQRAVWDILRTIPYGKTSAYRDIAIRMGKPKAYRAVGLANNRNPIAIIVPCHRVIGRDGSLTGYAGGLPVKQYLLDLEKRYLTQTCGTPPGMLHLR
jgi:methylated-DNA-[protein]-cysteine S-methyltransferase